MFYKYTFLSPFKGTITQIRDTSEASDTLDTSEAFLFRVTKKIIAFSQFIYQPAIMKITVSVAQFSYTGKLLNKLV